MSEEEKVTQESETLKRTMAPKAKIWPIVLSVIFVAVIAFFVAFLHWHEQPSFCSTMCHNNMAKYVDGYYSEDDSLLVSKHAEAGVTCLGCHWSQAKMMDLVHEVVLYVSDGYTDPLTDHTEFVNDAFCGTCHDGNLEETNHAQTKEQATEGQVLDPHNIPDIPAHQAANITCGDCHSVHKTSTMACAQCHDGMVEVPEGWTTPEVSVNVMANHSASVSTDKCVTCHNDTIAPSKETAVEQYQYTWNGEAFDFHNMSEELTTAHEGFVEGFSCQTCHENNSVAACATCHADVFTSDNLPEGWTAEAAEDESADEAEATDESADSEAAASDAAYTDGEYTASSKGIGGDVPVTVTITDGKISDVTVGDNSETQGIGSKAIDELPAKIVEANGTEGVDAVSGASVTSKAIFTAVNDCLEQASAGEAAAADTAAATDATYTDGEYTAEGKGIGGKVPVTVTITDGKISDVTVGDNSETQGIGSKAIDELPAKIVEANGTDGVDAVSGASVTSKAIFTAVEDCLEQASK